MKKLLISFLTMSIIVISGLNSYNYTYCNDFNAAPELSYGEKILQKFIYKDLDTLDKRIQLLGKNALQVKCAGDSKKIDEYLKDIDTIVNDINYLLVQIRQAYDEYKEDLAISNGMLTMGTISSNYRLALGQMQEYLLAQTPEEEYRTLANYFSLIKSAANGLSGIKEYVPKP